MNMILKHLKNKLSHWSDMAKVYSIVNLKKGKHYVIAPFNTISRKGGLADRLRHCLSLYLFCKKNNLTFKIFHNEPFELSYYLSPNLYNWEMDKDDFSKSFLKSKIIELWSGYKSLGISENDESKIQESSLKRFITSPNKQYHIYGNLHLFRDEWAVAFKELFKPSTILENELKIISTTKYDAATFRFQQLLGDFEEGDFPVLPKEEQDKLVNQCLEELKLKYKEGYFTTERVLVTSDSRTFLKEARKLPFVIITEGKIYHPGYSSEDAGAYMKSFVDLYALISAESVTLFKRSDMFLSGFPEFAASIGGKEFRIHSFEKS